MAFDIAAFIEKNKENLSAEEQKELNDGYMRNADYHSKMNAGKLELQRKQADEDAYALRLEQWRAAQEGRLSAAEILEQRLGVPIEQLVASPTHPAFLQSPATGEMISKADVQKLVDAKIAELIPAIQGTFHLTTRMPQYAYDYQTKYGKPFDGQKFVEFCTENKISDSDLGYKLYTVEDEKKLNTTQHAKELAEARAEGERSALSRHHIPEFASRPPLRSPLMRQPAPATAVATPTPVPASAPTPVPVPVPPVAAPIAHSPVPAALDGANALAASMQEKFLKAL